MQKRSISADILEEGDEVLAQNPIVEAYPSIPEQIVHLVVLDRFEV